MPKKQNKGFSREEKQFRDSFIGQTVNGRNFTVDKDITRETIKKPIRLEAKRVRDKDNPKHWYTKYTIITPAKNVNRPMEPIFNSAFNENGTNGVPKFVDVDIAWTGYADTFMMNQVSYNAMQNIRKSLKSNLNYQDEQVKQCLVNGIALACIGKQLERDVHWNLYDSGNDFNFVKMYKRCSQTVGTYGVVELIEPEILQDDNLPHTSSIYNKAVSIYNNVLKVPSAIGEFISHYLGSVFTLDKDGHNDQYLRLNMRYMDWYLIERVDGVRTATLTTINVFEMTLDEFVELLDAYSREFAVILADLDKCLAINRIGIQKYDSYTYAFLYDRTLMQALINGYTSDSAVNNNFVRMDQMSDVDDDLTQFLFLGALQPADRSKSNVKAIQILDMVLKINSDENLYWPDTLDQLLPARASDGAFRKNEPFGLSIITDVQSNNTITASVAVSEDETTFEIPTADAPQAAAMSDCSELTFNYGVSKGTWPGSNGIKFSDKYIEEGLPTGTHQVCGLIYVGTIATSDHGDVQPISYFLFTRQRIGDLSGISPRVQVDGDYMLAITWGFDDTPEWATSVHARLCTIFNEHPRTLFFGCNSDDNISTLATTRLVAHLTNHVLGLDVVLKESYESDGHCSYADLFDFSSVDFETSKFGITYRRDSWFDDIRAYYSFAANGMLTIQLHELTITGITGMIQATRNGSNCPLLALRNLEGYGTASSDSVDVSLSCGMEGIVMYTTQVIDYHIPIFYKRVDNVYIGTSQYGSAAFQNASKGVLVKEDYIPYYYNVLDLIPVLYEMFVSLFAIDGKKRQERSK